LLLAHMGRCLRPAPQQEDRRVPWRVDQWQRELLDALDSRTGALVLAPTSAGKTFAAYYAMERVLRGSNTGAVLVAVPTSALAAQIEAEISVRFGQKPYPHDGFSLVAALVPGRRRRLARKAQIIVVVPQFIEEVLADEDLWARLEYVVCDEIHMQPSKAIRGLARCCGERGTPLLAMSATIPEPEQLRTKLARATQSSDFQLVCHEERAVDLCAYHWNRESSALSPVHPLLLQHPEDVRAKSQSLHLAPREALVLWQAMDAVVPDVAGSLSPAMLSSADSPEALVVEAGRNQMPTRSEYRSWERALVSGLGSLADDQLSAICTSLEKRLGVVSGPLPGQGGCPGPPEVLSLLESLKSEGLLPCICFHRSDEQRTHLVLVMAELLMAAETAKRFEMRGRQKDAKEARAAAWELQCQLLRQQVEQLEEQAQARLVAERTKRARPARGHRDQEDREDDIDERAPEVRGGDADAPDAEWGSAPDVSGDKRVRAARAALKSLVAAGPEDDLFSERAWTFVPDRPGHVFGAEIRILLAHVEAGLKELGRRRGQLWAQSIMRALQRGVALHLEDEACEGINLAMTMLFRLGHVQVIVAGESLGCGANLPCRTSVILDPQIEGAMLTQMAGRAGRRGLDLEGATVFVHDLATLRRMRSAK